MTEDKKAMARTRDGKRFITFPVSIEAKLQFDMFAVQRGVSREELMREALHDLLIKHGLTPHD